MNRPCVKDAVAWQQMIMEHRAILFERLLAEFPDVLANQREKVALWKSRIQRL